MVRTALLVGAPALPIAWGAGHLAGGVDGALSASLGVIVVTLNFAAHGLSLAWAAGISVTAVQVVALGGFVARMGIITGLLFGLDTTGFFSPLLFGLTAVAGTLALLAYEARLVAGGLGAGLEIPPDPAAARAREALRLREGAR